MKYVIFKDKHGTTMPVIFPDHITHAQVIVDGAEPVSAGFFALDDFGT